MHPLEVLRRPVITEKSTILSDNSKYVFEVAVPANKVQVKEAVEDAFDVDVISVNIMRLHGKTKRYGNRTIKTKTWKKAIVTLKPGQKIEIFEGV